MGYTTEFQGEIKIDPPLNEQEIAYLRKFAETRRMKRKNGPYFIEGTDMFGQGRDPDVIDHNSPDPSQPGLWCQWVPTDDGTALMWDEGEKFYESEHWMMYIINHFIGTNPIAKKELPFLQGHTCNGEILAQGESITDRWKLIVKDNKVTTEDLQ